MPLVYHCFAPNGLRYPLVGGWDSTWKQKNIQARKILENGAESHQSGGRVKG
jgi:hypothetical protein